MQEFKAEVNNIVYSNEENGYTVARVRARKYPGLITICGHLGSVAPGEMLELKGIWKEHRKYGRQFIVQDFRQLYPASINGIRRYLSSNMIKGVGPVMAQRLIDKLQVVTSTIFSKSSRFFLSGVIKFSHAFFFASPTRLTALFSMLSNSSADAISSSSIHSLKRQGMVVI
jgi:ATP-dependent exoDNAse (exonuclease V) alpha subunit